MMNKTLFKLVPALRQANCFHWLTIMLIIPAFFVTGCSDDAASPGGSGAETADLSAISLTYHHFTASDDVIILNADTTRIAVSKALADKMGITRFSGRPMAVWQKVNSLPYIRRVTSEMLDNGRYVLTVDKSASLADVLPEDAEINFDTKIHVNHQAAKAWTRAGGTNAVEDMSARYMEGRHHPSGSYPLYRQWWRWRGRAGDGRHGTCTQPVHPGLRDGRLCLGNGRGSGQV